MSGCGGRVSALRNGAGGMSTHIPCSISFLLSAWIARILFIVGYSEPYSCRPAVWEGARAVVSRRRGTQKCCCKAEAARQPGPEKFQQASAHLQRGLAVHVPCTGQFTDRR